MSAIKSCPRLDTAAYWIGSNGIEFYTLRVCAEPMNGLVVVYICPKKYENRLSCSRSTS